MALRDAAAAGRDVRGATAYVTPEPCAWAARGRAAMLIQARVVKVVASCRPKPAGGGPGFTRLGRRALRWWWAPGKKSSSILVFSRMVRGTPWVRLPEDRHRWMVPRRCTTVSSRRISGGRACRRHYLAGTECAVLTGIVARCWPTTRCSTCAGCHAAPAAAGGGGTMPAANTARRLSFHTWPQLVPSTLQARFDRNFQPVRSHAGDAAAPRWCICRARTAESICRHAARPGGARRERIACQAGHRAQCALVRAGLMDELLLYLAQTPRPQAHGRYGAAGNQRGAGAGVGMWIAGPDLRVSTG